MALDLGELVGYLKLDATDWDKTMDGLPERAKGKAVAFATAGAVIGTALAAAIATGVNDALNFEQVTANLQGQLGMTEAEAARSGEAAGRAYRNNFGESLEQAQTTVANLMTRVEGMADASDSRLDGMTAKVLTYANAYQVDAADAVNMVGQLLDNNLAGSAEEAMDLMTTAMQKVPTALRGDLTDAINEYGPHLAAMGYTGQEAFDLLLRGADKGMYGIDKAGDAMKELSIRSTDMSTASVDAYNAIGLNAQDMATKMLAGGDQAREATDQIVAGLLGMDDPAARANAAIALFGTPLEDIAVSDIPLFLGSLQTLGTGMEDTAGSAQGMVDVVGGTSASAMETFQRSVQLVFMEIGENLLPVLSAFFGFLNEHQDLIPIIVAALGALAIGLGIAAAAQWVMNSALLASPTTWIIVGVMALIAAIVLLVQNWDTVVAWLSDVWDATVEWFTGTLDAIAAWWSRVWQSIADFFTGLWEGLTSWLRSTWESLTSWLMAGLAAYAAFWRSIWDGVGSFFRGLWEGVSSFFRGLWTTLVSWVMAYLNAYVAFWSGLWDGVTGTFRAVWQALKDWAVSLVSGLVSFWRGAFQGVANWLGGLWSSISDGARSTWQGLVDWLGDIPDTIMGFFSGIGTWLWDSGRNLVQGLLDGIKSLGSTIGRFFLDLLPGWIVGPFKAALGIHSPSRVFFGYGANTIQGYLDAIEAGKYDVDAALADLVDTQRLEVASTFSGSAQAQAVTAAAQPASEFHYHAAENRSLSAEEDLFAALASPRVGGGL